MIPRIEFYMSSLLIVVTGIAIVLKSTTAHSHLAQPLPTRKLHCRVGSQQGRDCYGPCPLPDDYGRLNQLVSPEQPAEIWARGESVTIRWHRNNHDGTGFVRFSLVPIDYMMDHKAHEKFAFHYACMDQGSHQCPDRSFNVCGNDAEGLAWKTVLEVPRVYEDGVYVFGWSWYGGGDFRGLSFFGDYYACSFIRIQGGASLEEQFQPLFDGPACPSSVDRLGVCWSEPCRIGRLHMMVPASFSNGGNPAPILRTDIIAYGGSTTHGEQSVMQGARSNGRRETLTEIEAEDEKLRVALLDLQTFEKVDLKDGAVYNLSNFPRGLTVEAFYDGNHDEIRVIEFYVDDVLMRREYQGPFVMNGNDGRRFYHWDVPVGRMVKVSVKVATSSDSDEKFEADIQFV